MNKRQNLPLLVILALYLAIGSFWIYFGSITPEEEVSIYAAKLAYQGKVPGEDFFYGGNPVWPYIYGFAQKTFGYGLHGARLASLLFGLMTVFFTFIVARRLAGGTAAVAAAVIIGLSPFAVQCYCVNAVGSLLALLSVLMVYILTGKARNSTKIIWAAVVADLAVGIHLAVVLGAALYFYYNRSSQGTEGRVLTFFARFSRNLLLVLFGLVFATVYFSASKQSQWIFSFLAVLLAILSRLRNKVSLRHLLPADRWNIKLPQAGLTSALAAGLFLIPSVCIRSVPHHLSDGIRHFFIPVLLLLVTAIYSWKKSRLYSAIACAAALFILVNTEESNTLVRYMPLVAILAGYGWAKISQAVQEKSARVLLNFFLIAAIVYSFLTQPVIPAAMQETRLIPPLNDISEVSAFVREHTKPQDTVLTCSPIIALQAERNLPSGWEEGLHSREEALYLGEESLKDVACVVLPAGYFYDDAPEGITNRVHKAINKDYRAAGKFAFKARFGFEVSGIEKWEYRGLRGATVYLREEK